MNPPLRTLLCYKNKFQKCRSCQNLVDCAQMLIFLKYSDIYVQGKRGKNIESFEMNLIRLASGEHDEEIGNNAVHAVGNAVHANYIDF